MVMLAMALGTIVLCSIFIMYACDSFEPASGYLGRNMPSGVRGATINAIGSSLPELMTTIVFLFGPVFWPAVYGDRMDAFSAGIATTAGSAIFNAVIIPAVCILAVMFVGVRQSDGTRKKIDHIVLTKSTVVRDGFFFLLAESALIWFLRDTSLVWWMGGALVLIYIAYFSFLMVQFKLHGSQDGDRDDGDDGDGDGDEGGAGILGLGWLLDFNARFFGGASFNTGRAWVVLAGATVVIGVACMFLVWAVNSSAAALGVAPYFTAVILAAGATSVPDTVLSVKDALNGEYDDAIANAVGSNIFDICVCLGLPLLVYGLFVGSVEVMGVGAAADVQILRVALFATTGVVLGLFLIGKRLGRGKAIALFGLYFVWTAFVILRAREVPWLVDLLGLG